MVGKLLGKGSQKNRRNLPPPAPALVLKDEKALDKCKEILAARKAAPPPPAVPALKGEEFLRFLLERGEGELAVCEGCGGGISFFGSLPDFYRCSCGGEVRTWDDRDWKRAADRVRQACRRDKTLLPTIKAERDTVHKGAPLPRLPAPFSWLYEVWEKTGYRPGRPFNPTVHYGLAHAVGQLERRGLSQREILYVLHQPRGVPFQRGRKKYANIPDSILWELGERVRKEVGPLPKSPQELGRSVRWARRQWSDPMARLRGERVKIAIKRPSSGRAGPEPRTTVPAVIGASRESDIDPTTLRRRAKDIKRESAAHPPSWGKSYGLLQRGKDI